MTSEVDNLVIEHLKALRNELRDFWNEAREEFATLKMRINSLERGVAGMHDDAATLQARIDSVDSRIDKMERRLELSELNNKTSTKSRGIPGFFSPRHPRATPSPLKGLSPCRAGPAPAGELAFPGPRNSTAIEHAAARFAAFFHVQQLDQYEYLRPRLADVARTIPPRSRG